MSSDSVTQGVVQNLNYVIADPNCNIVVQLKALLVLRFLSSKYLDDVPLEQWNVLKLKLKQLLVNDEHTIYLKEVFLVSFNIPLKFSDFKIIFHFRVPLLMFSTSRYDD